MKDHDTFSKFIQNGNFSQEKIDEIKDYYDVSDKQLVRKTFKFLNSEIGDIKNNIFFELIITNGVNFLFQICNNTEFNEDDVIINRKRIKKTREALLANANKFNNQVFMDAANKMDEIILDKNINLDDLKNLLIRLIERKEEINIIKKLLNTNKGVLLINKNDIFDYIFNLALYAIKNNTCDIYYYISLLKVFYTSNINKKEYVEKLNEVSDETNLFANEIYMILFGVKRGLKPEEIINKYGIITDFSKPNIHIPSDSYYDEFILTIDGEKTKLRDDGISIKKDGENYIVGIHIADPTTIVKPQSREDLIAKNNYKCLYNPKTSLFSKELERQLSLYQNEPRNVISMYVTISKNGDIINYYITENVIKASYNLSYQKCNNLFITKDNLLSPPLYDLYDVASILDSKNPLKKEYWRKKENLSNEKELKTSKGDKIVSELMVLYGVLIATIMCDKSLPYTYRINDPSYIKNLIKSMKIELDESTKKIIDNIYMDSKYSIYPRYHNGLHVPIYSHSTDSLRRYPDLYNLYLLHSFYFNDLKMNFKQDEFEELVSYFNQRNIELSLMKSEYQRALVLKKAKTQL